ncbi:MAG: BON domain-containing protein [Terriglobia bacterium]
MSLKTGKVWRVCAGIGLLLSLLACSKAPSDVTVSDAIKGRFYSDPQLKNENIQVSVANGEATLSGQVSGDPAHQQAVSVAQGTEGVKKVIDQLQFPSSPGGMPPMSSNQLQSGSSPGGMPPMSSNQQQSMQSPQSGGPAAGGSPAAENVPGNNPPAPEPPPPPPPRKYTIPSGTNVRIQMIDTIDSKTSKPGDSFRASLASPIVSGNDVVVRQGANVVVKLLESKTSGKFKGQSELEVTLDQIELNGKRYDVSSSSVQEVGKSRGKDTAKKTGLGAAIGAGIGAIAGGGKGAAIGAGIGAGAGAGSQLFLKGKQVSIPSETKLDFKLSAPVTFTLPPKS